MKTGDPPISTKLSFYINPDNYSLTLCRCSTMPQRIAVVLPKHSRFDRDHPTSIDSVVRQLVEHSSFKNRQTVFRPPTKAPVTSVPSQEFRHRNPFNWKRRLRNAVSEIRPACIEVHQSIYLAGYLAKRFNGVPVVLFRHNLIQRPRTERKTNKYLGKLKNLWKIVFVSDFATRHFQSNWPEFSSRAQTVPNFTSVKAWFNPVNASRKQDIVYLGRPIADKGFEEFCEGIAPVLRNHQQWSAKIVIYEWDKHRHFAQPILSKLASAAANTEVLVDRPVAEIRGVVKNSEIVVVPSKWAEPFGLAALEAHLAGAAVISSGRGGLREISGDAAYYLASVTPEAITRAVTALIDDGAMRKDLQRRGQDKCVHDFDPTVIARRYDDLRVGAIRSYQG